MIKKRYLIILSVAIVSVLFGSLLYSRTTLAQKGKEPTQVEVTNFPLDGEGNLRATIVPITKTMLVFNESLTVPSNPNSFIYLTSFNTSGFKYAYIKAKAQGAWQVNANIEIWFFDNNFGIQTQVQGTTPHFSLHTGSDAYRPYWGTGTSGMRYEIQSTTTDLSLVVYNSDIGFDGLLTIAVFLTN